MKTVLLSLLLCGCVSFKGVQMDDDERKACAVEGCAVFTAHELRNLALKYIREGVILGRKSL
jgi:hypothetical protein